VFTSAAECGSASRVVDTAVDQFRLTDADPRAIDQPRWPVDALEVDERAVTATTMGDDVRAEIDIPVQMEVDTVDERIVNLDLGQAAAADDDLPQ
jgi:hypothetical protein